MAVDVRRGRLRCDATYDIETEGWDRYLVGGVYNGRVYKDFTWSRESDLASDLSRRAGRVVWAQNGVPFRHKSLLARLARTRGRAVHIRCAGARITSLRIHDGPSAFDSRAASGLSLESLTAGLRVQKKKQPLRCLTPTRCGDGCRGYCRFRRAMPRRDLESVRDYLRADCVSLFQALGRLNEWADTYDVELAPTIGGAAWRDAKAKLGLPDASLSLADHGFAREGTFGGRCQVFRVQARSCHEYDVNSMYPNALRSVTLPWGRASRRLGRSASIAYADGREGFFRARVRVPDLWIPPLPIKAGGRNCYPTGTFSGVWTGVELRYAEEIGCRILAVTEALAWDGTYNPFGAWVDKLWRLRATAEGGKSGPFGQFLKRYMNSLTGKLGMRPGGTAYVYNPIAPKPDWQYLGNSCWLYALPEHRRTPAGWVAGAPCCHVEWYAYVTAAGRISWHRQAGEDAIYCDTDGLYCLNPRTRDVGEGLGQWQDRGVWDSFEAIAPKFYRLSRAATGETVVRSKGVRARFDAEWEDLFKRGTHTFERSVSEGYKSAARNARAFESITLRRTIARGTGDRVLMLDGTTRPPTARELGLCR